MMVRRFLVWLLLAGLLSPISAAAELGVDTESLKLKFSDQGDLILA